MRTYLPGAALCALLLICGCSDNPADTKDVDDTLAKATLVSATLPIPGTNASIEFIRIPMAGDTMWVSRKEITEGIYSEIMGGGDPNSEFPKALSWYQSVAFANKVTQKCSLALQLLRDTLRTDTNTGPNDPIPASFGFEPAYDSLRLDTLTIPRILGANYIYCADTDDVNDTIPGSACTASLDTFFTYRGKYFFLFDTLPDSLCLRSLADSVQRYTDTLVIYPDTFVVTLYTRHSERYGFRLPTEDEWEAIAMAGRNIVYSTYNGKLSEEGAVYGRSAAAEVGSKPSNPYRFYDVTGNLWEWTEDWWSANGLYSVTDSTPRFPAKVIKGGCFADNASSPNLKNTESYSEHPGSTLQGKTGVRLVIEDSVFWIYRDYFVR